MIVDSAIIERANEIVHDMTMPGMEEVGLAHGVCGQVNSFYMPTVNTIILCDEMIKAYPKIIPAVIAHEMGHAIIHQLDIPFTGSEEAAADEISLVYMTNSGHLDETWDVALAYAEMNLHERYQPRDDHPNLANRAFNFACAATGAEEALTAEPSKCKQYQLRISRNWARLLVAYSHYE